MLGAIVNLNHPAHTVDWSFIHMSDVGGRVSGSIAPSSYEVYQEGIRIPPQKLFRAGRLDEGFLKMFLANTRTPDPNWGDMKACLAGLNTAERRVQQLLDRFGAERIEKGIDLLAAFTPGTSASLVRAETVKTPAPVARIGASK